MKIKKTALLALLCAGIMTVSTGCSISGLMDKVVGETSPEEEKKTETQVKEKEDIKDVDNNLAKPEFTTDLEGSVSYGMGQTAEPLTVEAAVADGGSVTYQWYINNVDSNGGGTPVEGATEPSFVPSTEEAGIYYYYVVATNNLNDKVSKATSSLVCVEILESAEPEASSEWVEDKKGWWYRLADGTYPANEWLEIEGKWYFFDQSGYMKTGWFKDGKDWYYLQKDGSMAVNTTVEGCKIDASGRWVK